MRAPFRGFLFSCVVVAVGCGSSHPPPPDPFSTEPEAGAAVLVGRGGKWVPATVVRAEGGGRYRVHYEGYGSEWDETVGADQVRIALATPPEPDYRAGEVVLVRVQGRIAVAQVITQIAPTFWRVHYDGFGPEAVEEVEASRIRRQFSGTSAHGVGEAVLIEVGGRPVPGKIVAILAADQWLVRFDGTGPDRDQEVGATRLYPSTQ